MTANWKVRQRIFVRDVLDLDDNGAVQLVRDRALQIVALGSDRIGCDPSFRLTLAAVNTKLQAADVSCSQQSWALLYPKLMDNGQFYRAVEQSVREERVPIARGA